MFLMSRTHGLVLSNAVKFAIVRSTVVFISVRKNAILKIITNLIVHAHRMWFYGVHAGRRRSLGSTDFLLERPARIPFPIARSHVGNPYLAGILVP